MTAFDPTTAPGAGVAPAAPTPGAVPAPPAAFIPPVPPAPPAPPVPELVTPPVGHQLYQVVRPFDGLGRSLRRGEVVDLTANPLPFGRTEQLIESRYLEPFAGSVVVPVDGRWFADTTAAGAHIQKSAMEAQSEAEASATAVPAT